MEQYAIVRPRAEMQGHDLVLRFYLVPELGSFASKVLAKRAAVRELVPESKGFSAEEILTEFAKLEKQRAVKVVPLKIDAEHQKGVENES